MTEMIRVTPRALQVLPSLEFPFNNLPSVWAPERTVLCLANGQRVPVFVWLYLKRSIAGPSNLYNSETLSAVRVASFPQAIQRLSYHFRLLSAGPKTVYSGLSIFARFLAWIDSEEHGGIFESVLSEPGLALQAFEIYHRHLKGKIRSHTLSRNSAANEDQSTLRTIRAIHNIANVDEIETLSSVPYRTTTAPKSEDIAQWMSTLTAVFDSAYRILNSCAGTCSDGTWRLSISTIDNSHEVFLPKGYNRTRLIELAAMSYAGLVIAESGANLAQVQAYEDPEDLLEQLAEPDRISLTQKVVKLRAGGKAVPVTMTAVTFTRLRNFIKIRHQLVELLSCNDIAPFFVQCEYTRDLAAKSRKEILQPVAVRAISDDFLPALRKKLSAVGAKLPGVTLRQLRAYKQQHFVRHYGLVAAADAMGHTIATSAASYSAAQDGVQANEMGRFMSSLHKTVIHHANRSNTLVSVPVGGCASYGNPSASDHTLSVEPTCTKIEGCFFCEQFRVHADEDDLRKVLSCQQVLIKIRHLQGESEQSDRVYESILRRVEVLLLEIQQVVNSNAFERIKGDVAAGNLTRYWAVKVQQLGLLGLIATK
jgi:hypothetical protein